MISHLGGGDAGNRDGTPGDGEEKRAGEGGFITLRALIVRYDGSGLNVWRGLEGSI